jgi:hypothetical protein
MRTKAHAIHALRLRKAERDGIIEVVGANLGREMQRVKEIANNLFFLRGKPILLIHDGEAEMLALARELGLKNVLIDERTTRLLVEAPFSLKEHLEEEFHKKIGIDEKNLHAFSSLTREMVLFRSSELLITAYEKGYFRKFEGIEKETLEAALYALKFNGCSIAFEEVKGFMRTLP